MNILNYLSFDSSKVEPVLQSRKSRKYRKSNHGRKKRSESPPCSNGQNCSGREYQAWNRYINSHVNSTNLKSKRLLEQKNKIIREQKEEIDKLRTEIFYMPGGEGEKLAKEEFCQLANRT